MPVTEVPTCGTSKGEQSPVLHLLASVHLKEWCRENGGATCCFLDSILRDSRATEQEWFSLGDFNVAHSVKISSP